MQYLIDVAIGVVSGVMSAFILFLFYKLKKSSFEPWLENRLYRGVILSGTWEGLRTAEFKSKEDEDNQMTHQLSIHMELKQNGYKVEGLFTAESTLKESDALKNKYTNFYKVSGHVIDNYLVLEYSPISRKRVGLGAFVMQVKDGGKSLRGSISFAEEGGMEITTFEDAVLNRKDDE